MESHNPLYEKQEQFLKILNNLKDKYEIIENGKYDFGNFNDMNRLFFILRKRN